MKNSHGFTLIELLITVGATTGLLFVAGQIILQLKRGEKDAFDDLMQLASQRLFAQIIRSDLRKAAPSYGVLNEAPDPSGSQGDLGSFFDINRALGCSEELPQCSRTLTIKPGGPKTEFYFLMDATEEGLGMNYDPQSAFSAAGSYTNLNQGNVLTTGVNAVEGGFLVGHLYLMTSPNEIPIYKLNQGQCQCVGTGTQFNCSQAPAGCGNTPTVPALRVASFIGAGSGAGLPVGSVASDLVRPQGASNSLFGNLGYWVHHPADDAIAFGNNPATFLKTLPAMGDMISRARIKKVWLVLYQVLPNKDLVRSVWSNHTATNGFNSSTHLVIANKVKQVKFRRPSISVGTMTFTMELEN